MSLQTAPDIPLIITVPGPSPSSPPLLSAERRISPSWTIGQLKAKLEPVTGIPPSAQRLRTRGFDGNWVEMEGEDKSVADREWGAGVRRGGEIEVSL
jgi:tubulin-specific chaperone B